jgi:hypothetical protein
MKKYFIVFLLGASLLFSGCVEKAQAPSTTGQNSENGTTVEKPQPSTGTDNTAGSAYKLFMVAMEDQGKTGKAIGCDDSIVGVGSINTTVSPAADVQTKLTAAYKELLADKLPEYGQSGLQNSLSRSNLKLDSVTINSGKATVKLSGQFSLDGVCDNPRVEAQLQEVALQFAEIKELEIYINDKLLKDALSLK